MVQWLKLGKTVCMECRRSRVRPPLRHSGFKERKKSLFPLTRDDSIVGRGLLNRDVACSISNHQGPKFESCVLY